MSFQSTALTNTIPTTGCYCSNTIMVTANNSVQDVSNTNTGIIIIVLLILSIVNTIIGTAISVLDYFGGFRHLRINVLVALTIILSLRFHSLYYRVWRLTLYY